jgi:anti-sigma-K factor RskA
MFLQDFSQWGRKKVQRVSASPDHLRASFLRYITGRLPEPDKTRFEERLLEDQDFSDTAAACEQELIDNYALRRLDAEETRAVGLWIEASPERVARVTMARALLQAAPQRGQQKKKTSITLAAAASLLAAATLYLVNSKMSHHQPQTTQLSASNTAPQDQTAAAATTKPDIVLIAAERTRGEQKTATYQIHRESPIQLQVLLPGETSHSGYQLRIVSLTDPSKTLLEQNELEAQSLAGQLYLTATLPPGSLPPATYTASVSRQRDTLISTFALKWATK